MEAYRRGFHAIYDIKYHLVWVTKCRYRVLTGEVGILARDLIRQVCQYREVEIIKGHIAGGHAHLFVSVPPSFSVSKLVQYVKDNSSHRMHMEFTALCRRDWGQHIWARGYFCASSDNVTDAMIKSYIEHQTEPSVTTLNRATSACKGSRLPPA